MTGTEFYEINDIQGGSNPSKTSDGKPDVISTLYNNDAVDEYVTYPEPYQNGYEVISTQINGTGGGWPLEGNTMTLKTIMSGTYRSFFSADVGDYLMF